MSDSETVVNKTVAKPAEEKSNKNKKKLPLGLDLGTLGVLYFKSKLSKPGSGQTPWHSCPHGRWAFLKKVSLAGILPGNSAMLHGTRRPVEPIAPAA